MAIGRLAGGAASRISPSGTARFFGAAAERSPELDYVVRVCGIRAMALGLGYLSTTGDARRRWQQLALLCDISDTVAGIGDLVRGKVPRSTALGATLRAGIFASRRRRADRPGPRDCPETVDVNQRIGRN